jgi:hypothetical protein
MSAWSNVQVSSGDEEISGINELEKAMDGYPDHIRQIRELITRFEVCHFKYRQHLENIRRSIHDLHPRADPAIIGRSHIQHGEQAWKSDKTGRSFMGQQYIWALNNWLKNDKMNKPNEYNEELSREVANWLGERNGEKDKLVRLLLARLMWDWKTLEALSGKSIEEISREGDDRGLEYQIYRMDICHFAFPVNLINVIRGIGEMRPVGNFEGCGSHNQVIRQAIHKEFGKINQWLISRKKDGIAKEDKEELTRIWLFACLAKTLKEQSGLEERVTIPHIQ